MNFLTAIIDQPNGFAYFGTWTVPGIVVKVDLATFTRVGALSLDAGEDYLTSAIIDQPNRFAYFGTGTSPGTVVKVNLATFTRVSALTLNAGESNLDAAVIDQPNGFAYFTDDATPGTIIKLDLATFTRVGALTLDPGENNLRSAIIDQANGFAYFGTDTSPGRCIKASINDAHMFGTTAAQLITATSDTTILGTTKASIYNPNMDLNGDLTINAGATFDASSSGALTIAGDFTNNGAFTPNSGTVTFDSAAACSITGTTMNDVVFDKQGATATVSGTLTATGNMTFTSAGSIGGGGLEVRGNLSGTDSSIAGTATMLFSGTTAQSYTAADIPDGDVTINKPSGTITLGANAAWNGTEQDLALTSGRLDQGASFDLSIGNITVSPGAELLNVGAGDLTVGGSVVNDGTVTIHGH